MGWLSSCYFADAQVMNGLFWRMLLLMMMARYLSFISDINLQYPIHIIIPLPSCIFIQPTNRPSITATDPSFAESRHIQNQPN